jgi:hypothetical protein
MTRTIINKIKHAYLRISIQLGIFGLLFKHFMSQLFDFFQKCVSPETWPYYCVKRTSLGPSFVFENRRSVHTGKKIGVQFIQVKLTKISFIRTSMFMLCMVLIYQVKIIQTSKSIFTKHPIHRLSIQNSVFSFRREFSPVQNGEVDTGRKSMFWHIFKNIC